MSAPDNATPRVAACIEAVMRRYPSDTSTQYYVAVHQDLAPLARALERENISLIAATRTTCAWTPDRQIESTWASACGELWSFIDGGPIENSCRFCHGCGKPLELVARPAGETPP